MSEFIHLRNRFDHTLVERGKQPGHKRLVSRLSGCNSIHLIEKSSAVKRSTAITCSSPGEPEIADVVMQTLSFEQTKSRSMKAACVAVGGNLGSSIVIKTF